MGSQPTCGGAAPDLAQKGHRQWSDLPHRMPEVSPKRTWLFDTPGGKRKFAAFAKDSCLPGKSGHSSPRRSKPTCCTAHQGQQCAESVICKVWPQLAKIGRERPTPAIEHALPLLRRGLSKRPFIHLAAFYRIKRRSADKAA